MLARHTCARLTVVFAHLYESHLIKSLINEKSIDLLFKDAIQPANFLFDKEELNVFQDNLSTSLLSCEGMIMIVQRELLNEKCFQTLSSHLSKQEELINSLNSDTFCFMTGISEIFSAFTKLVCIAHILEQSTSPIIKRQGSEFLMNIIHLEIHPTLRKISSTDGIEFAMKFLLGM